MPGLLWPLRPGGLHVIKAGRAPAEPPRDGNVLGNTVTWQAMNDSVAEISQNGAARGEGAGTSRIQASAEGVTGSAVLVVKDVEGKADGPPL